MQGHVRKGSFHLRLFCSDTRCQTRMCACSNSWQYTWPLCVSLAHQICVKAFTLEQAFMAICSTSKNKVINTCVHNIFYADDSALVSDNEASSQELFVTFDAAARGLGLSSMASLKPRCSTNYHLANLTGHPTSHWMDGHSTTCRIIIIIIIITLLSNEINGNESWRSSATNYESEVRPTEQICI